MRMRAAVLFTAGSVVTAASMVLSLGLMPTAAAAGCPSPGGAGAPQARSPRAEIVIRGHGWGHGMGMSQYGAQGAARLGCSYRTILSTYYRNTRLVTRAMNAPVLVSLMAGAARATVQAETGPVRWNGSAVQPKGETWTVVRRGAGLSVRDGDQERAWVPDGTTLAAAHSGAVVRIRSFRPNRTTPGSDLRTRWDTTRFTGGGGRFTVVQQIVGSSRTTSVQKYLWGLAEVPSSWPQDALRAQAVAARTYLLAKLSAGAYRLQATTADQVYRGWAKESSDYRGAWRAAVDATRGEVLVDPAGRGITAMYSSSMGGYTEDRQYVYGRYGISYLKAVDDSRWDRASDNPYRSWVVGLSKRQLAAKFGFSSITSAKIAPRGSSGRLSGLRVTGVVGGRRTTKTFTGAAVRYKLGLRSPGFTLTIGSTAETIPPGAGTEPETPAPAAPEPVEPAPVQPLAGDWDGDGTTDAGWYDNGSATVRVGGKAVSFRFGVRGDTVVVGDWDGDGADGIAVFRAGRWFLRNRLSTGVADRTISYGRPGDAPVAGRFGTGPADGVGVVRGGVWHLRFTPTGGVGERAFTWAGSGTPLVGDWNGDGLDDPGRYLARRFTLALAAAGTGGVPSPTVHAAPWFGAATDLPLTGDWDGDGKHTPAVVRGSAFLWRDDLAGGTGTGALTFPR
jgi:stage II sporulation protein D